MDPVIPADILTSLMWAAAGIPIAALVYLVARVVVRRTWWAVASWRARRIEAGGEWD